MKKFYATEERILSLRFHAGEMVDTPFAHNAMVPGAGVDCVHVNAWAYLKSGFLKSFNPPRYALDSGLHARESQLLAWFYGHREFLSLEDGQPLLSKVLCGDSICFNLGLSEHHVGLMLDDKKFVHVLPHRRVIVSSLEERYYARRITAVYRPIEH
jgi:cell wall-associated NlpC family hydrolase